MLAALGYKCAGESSTNSPMSREGLNNKLRCGCYQPQSKNGLYISLLQASFSAF